MGLSCRISCRACPRPTWRVPRPQQLIWRCLAPPATIGSSRSTRSARCTGGSATCHGGAVQRSTNSRFRGARAALEASSSPHSTVAPRRSEESARIDLQTTTHRRCCAQPRRRWRPWESRKWAASRPAWQALHSMTSRGCRVDTRPRSQGLQGERQGRQGRKTRVFGLFDRSTTYFGPGLNCTRQLSVD